MQQLCVCYHDRINKAEQTEMDTNGHDSWRERAIAGKHAEQRCILMGICDKEICNKNVYKTSLT